MIKTFAFLAIVVMFLPPVITQKGLKTVSTNSVVKAQTKMEDSSVVKDHLENDIVGLISKAKRIKVYHLKPFVTDTAEKKTGKKYFAEYEVLGSKKANNKRRSELKRALLDGENYITDYTNKCTFTATIGLEIYFKKEKLDVLISYRCQKLLFLRNNIETYREVRSLERFDRLARELFKGPLEVTMQ